MFARIVDQNTRYYSKLMLNFKPAIDERKIKFPENFLFKIEFSDSFTISHIY